MSPALHANDAPLAHRTPLPSELRQYACDPVRDPALLVRAKAPFNAEPPLERLLESFVTPNELFFVRNHLPVPDVEDGDASTITFAGLGLAREVTFTLAELKEQFTHHAITVTIQCAGNRRREMSQVRTVRGLVWDKAAISTAKWTGVRLADVLAHLGINEQHEMCPLHQDGDFDANPSDDNDKGPDCASCDAVIRHVHFEALDVDATDSSRRYGASIPIATALDPRKDVLLAFAMNDAPLPRDHGFPLRAIVPGTVGARNVKFLRRIELSHVESPSFWQQHDYRAFPPSVDYNTPDFAMFAGAAIQEMPVQSVVVQPVDGATLRVQAAEHHVSVAIEGYAYSGGGRNIVRVDVSIDGGATWTAAALHCIATKQRHNRAWAWTPWRLDARVPLAHDGGEREKQQQVEIICKAIDASFNVQPESIAPIWNLRGMLNNAWHRVCIDIVVEAPASVAGE